MSPRTTSSAALKPAPPTRSRAQLLRRARRYWYGDLLWSVIAQFWFFVVLWLLVRTRRAGVWRDWALRRLRRSALALLPFTALMYSVVATASLPFGFYEGWWRERAFGFARQSAGGWLGDWGKSFAVELLAVLAVVEIIYAILRWRERRERADGEASVLANFAALESRPGKTPSLIQGVVPTQCWRPAFYVWLPCVAFMVAAVALQPVLIAPLFQRTRPLPAGPLRGEIAAMAARAGIPKARILVVDTSRRSAHTNAYVVGLLGSQRIVIYDTLLKAETTPQIEFTVGHEMGHYVLRHIWRGVGFGAALLLLLLWITFRLYRHWAPGLGYRGLADFAGLPLLALILSVLFFLALPLTNGYSRRLEHQADAFGLRLAPDPCAAAASFRQDLATDLIPPNPPTWIRWWFFNHPSDAERIAFAEKACELRKARR